MWAEKLPQGLLLTAHLTKYPTFCEHATYLILLAGSYVILAKLILLHLMYYDGIINYYTTISNFTRIPINTGYK